MAQTRKQPVRGRVSKYTPKITLEGCWQTIRELAEAGEREPSVKLALWAAALSPQKKLAPNGKQTRKLALFVHQPLPADRSKLHALVQQGSGGFLTTTQVNAVYAIEQAEIEGNLPEMPQADWSLERWIDWRDEVAKLPGLGLKTASFAGLLLCPAECPLVPVDMWVMIRLGFDHDSPKNRAEYAAIVEIIRDERDRDCHNDIPLGAWHWFKWSEIRQACGAEPLSERPESHKDLSPKWY